MKLSDFSEWFVPLAGVATIATFLLGSLAVGRINETRHLSGLDLDATQDFAVRLAFEPERFHIEAFQDVGRYQGWREDHAVIMAVDKGALRRLARNYWIGSIGPLEETQ